MPTGLRLLRGLAMLGTRSRPSVEPGATWQLLVDVSHFHQLDAGTGIQRVIREVLHQLTANPPTGCLVRPVAATRRAPYRYIAQNILPLPANQPIDEQMRRLAGQRIQAKPGDIFLELDFAARVLNYHWMQLWQLRQKGARMVAVVHDLLPMQQPEWFTAAGVRNCRSWLNAVAIFFDQALCVSQVTASAMEQWLTTKARLTSQDRPRLGVVHLASSFNLARKHAPEFLPFPGKCPARRPVLLTVGTIEPRKCYDKVLSAMEQLWARGSSIQLVLVGHLGWRTEAFAAALAHHPEAGQRLIWLQDANDSVLASLYQMADGLVSASAGEGFGLPLVEAANCGLPIFCRDIPVFREILGTNATYFSDDEPESLATSLAQWVEAIRTQTAIRPVNIVRRTWQEATQDLLGHFLA